MPSTEATLCDEDTDPEALVRRAGLGRGEIAGRYVVLDRLGSGGMGVVYSAYDPDLDRKVALKLLLPRPGASRGSGGSTRLLREAQAMAKVNHPNVVTVHDVGTMGDRVFVAMEFLEGHTLRAWLEARSRPWRQVLDAFMRAGRGLAAAHAAGLVHRDFKPDNVMLALDESRDAADAVGRVVVMDFGLAHAARSTARQPVEKDPATDEARPSVEALSVTLTRDGALVGTPAYMAPEQHLDHHSDERSDQFAFCVALYEGLYGQRPFDGESPAEVAFNAASGRVCEAPSSSRIPNRLRQVVLRGLSVDPDARWPTMDAMLDALGAVETHRRRRLGIAAALVAAGIAVAAVSMRSGTDDPCDDAGKEVERVWNDDRRATISAAIERAGVPFGADTNEKLERTLDEYSAGWALARREVCRMASQRADASADLVDRRIACLSEGLRALEGVVGVVEHADDEVIRKSVEVAASLPRVERCDDEAWLLARIKPPPAGTAREVVAQVRDVVAAAKVLLTAGKYHEAKAMLDGIWPAAIGVSYSPAQAEALLARGRVEYRLGLEDALPTLQEAYYVASAAEHEEVAAEAAAIVALGLGRVAGPEDAQTWVRLADTAMRRTALPPEVEARVLAILGLQASAAGRYEAARARFDESLALLGRTLGPDDLQLVLPLEGAANLDRLRGDLPGARQRHERVLSIMRDRLGTEHPDVAGALNNIAAVALAEGQAEEALELYGRSLKIYEAALPPAHPALGAVRNNMGTTLQWLGRFEEALEHHRGALEMRRAVLGPRHPSVAMSLSNIGIVLTESGRPDEALDPLDQARAIWEQTLGPDHPDTAYAYNNLAAAHLARGDHREAIELATQALQIRKTTLGDDHILLSCPLTTLGRAHLARHQAAQALPLLEHALRLRARGEVSPRELAETRFALAQSLWATGEHERALALAQKAQSTTVDPTIEAWLADHSARRSDSNVPPSEP